MGRTEEKTIVALHETGHLIVMYALGLINSFNGFNLINDNGKLRVTDMNHEFQEGIQSNALSLVNLATNYNQS